ncbi:MAG: hypothetical protein H7246_05105, partial [Phycisphaerae bacterium]|nr:hypothetical protein [Saprospiraceae bacterium]
MQKSELTRLFFREAEKICLKKDLPRAEAVILLYRLMESVFIEVTKEERIHFTTLFARIAYVCHRKKVPGKLQLYIHSFRRSVSELLKKPEAGTADIPESVYNMGVFVATGCIANLFDSEIPGELQKILPAEKTFLIKREGIVERLPQTRVVALADDPVKQQLLVRDETNFTKNIFVQYNIAERNENFNPTIQAIRQVFGFPVSLNLIDVAVDRKGIYKPRAFVVEPDYLIDVTAIAETFKDFGTEPLLHLVKKFQPFETSTALMLGNIANFFLDELMTHPGLTFQELKSKIFKLNPLAITLFDNFQVKEMMDKSQKHFINIKQMVLEGFEKQGIKPANCYLEPSFYAPVYGIQGRLDVFYQNPDNKKEAAIVELKSGRPYRTNAYGINHNHFTQTLLYDLLLKAAFGQQYEPANYILYSGEDVRQLRFAPTIKSQQYEALQIRNQLVAIEQQLISLQQSAPGQKTIFHDLNLNKFAHLKGFEKKDLEAFEKTFSEMSALERSYFIAFSGFIAAEHRLAKTGVQGIENANGVAGLWLNDAQQKEDNFDIIRSLTIETNHSTAEDPLIVFRKTEFSNRLANFRIGDIVVIYPSADKTLDGILHNQIFKSTVVAITPEDVTVRLRCKQFNNNIFKEYKYWNIEHDLLD